MRRGSAVETGERGRIRACDSCLKRVAKFNLNIVLSHHFLKLYSMYREDTEFVATLNNGYRSRQSYSLARELFDLAEIAVQLI